MPRMAIACLRLKAGTMASSASAFSDPRTRKRDLPIIHLMVQTAPRRILRRPARRFLHYLGEAQTAQVEALDKRVYHTDWIILPDPLPQARRNQNPLIKRYPLDVPHRQPRCLQITVSLRKR